MRSFSPHASSLRLLSLPIALGGSLLLATPQHAAGQALSRSQALLSGHESPGRWGMTWPETLELPAAWEAGFRELALTTRQTGREVVACLTVENQLSSTRYFTDRLPVLQRLRDLRDRRDSLSEADWARESSALRASLETTGIRDDQLAFKVGDVQFGHSMGAHLVSSATTCPGSTVGQVHTHPGVAALHSDMDLVGALTRPQVASWVEAVVSAKNNGACLVVAAPHDANREPSRRGRLWFRNDLADLGAGWALFQESPKVPPEGTDQIEMHWEAARMRSVLAVLAYEPQAALYCGVLGQPLKRAKPSSKFPDVATSPGLVLASKGMAVMMRELFGAAVPAIDFPFTPDLDGAYLAYLRRSGVLTDEQEREVRTPNHASLWNFQEAAFGRLAKKQGLPVSRVVEAGGILIPDPRDLKDRKAFSTRVLYYLDVSKGQQAAGVQNCKVLDWESDPPRVGDCKTVAEYLPRVQR